MQTTLPIQRVKNRCPHCFYAGQYERYDLYACHYERCLNANHVERGVVRRTRAGVCSPFRHNATGLHVVAFDTQESNCQPAFLGWGLANEVRPHEVLLYGVMQTAKHNYESTKHFKLSVDSQVAAIARTIIRRGVRGQDIPVSLTGDWTDTTVLLDLFSRQPWKWHKNIRNVLAISQYVGIRHAESNEYMTQRRRHVALMILFSLIDVVYDEFDGSFEYMGIKHNSLISLWKAIKC